MNMTEIAVLILLLLVAVGVVIASIMYRVNEVHEEAAAWDALIERTRRGGGS